MNRPLIVMMVLLALTGCEKDEPGQVLVESIEVLGDDIVQGTTRQMSAVVLPENAHNKVVGWRVSDEDIATISQSGLLTATANGTVTVTVTATDGSRVVGEKDVTITSIGTENEQIKVAQIIVTGGDIADAFPKQFEAEVLPEDATNKEVEWSVSDESIAGVSATGLVSPRGNGVVKVIATATDGSGVSGELEITISGQSIWQRVSTPEELLEAVSNAGPGDSIMVDGGTYEMTARINLSSSGTANEKILLFGDPGDRPLLDFSSFSEGSSNQGIKLTGSHWYIKGLDVYNAGDNGMQIQGDENLIEFCSFFECADTGLQLDNGATNNTILNCDSYNNADASIENADGFAAKLTVGSGTKFIGCRAWQNLDDGWDGYLRGVDNVTTTYENCWAIRNGYLKDGTVGGGDGNGFKTGGSDDKDLSHDATYTRCIAVGNTHDGFDHNSNRGVVEMYHCSAYDNGRNVSFSNSRPLASLTIKNSAVMGDYGTTLATATDVTNNSWQDGITVTEADFQSLDVDQLMAPRKADGSLPDINFMHLVTGSDLIDAGVDVGLDFSGAAPDLGAFELE